MVEIIILAMIAAFIFLRLRSVLGRRPDEDSAPGAPGQGPLHRAPAQSQSSTPSEEPGQVVPMEADPALRRGYRAIRSVDAGFDAEAFVQGAMGAYSLILESFWAGNKDDLRPFVSDDVYEQFAGAIDSRAEQGHEVRNKIIDLSGAQAVAAGVDNDLAEIDVKFTAEIVTYVVDGEGRGVEGNPSDTIEVQDIWTFQRPVQSSDPNWVLVATRSE